MSAVLTQLKLNQIKGVLSTALSLKDKALLMERELGLEPFYTMISMGQSISTLAASMNISNFELEYMLKRTSNHRKQYMNAVSTQLANDSSNTLKRFKGALLLDKEQAAAARHHTGLLDRSLKVLNSQEDGKGAGNVIVNNTVIVRDNSDIPPMPDGLDNIIEVEDVNS